MLENASVKAKFSTMSLQQLRKKGRKEEMFIFAVSTKPFKDSKGSSNIKLQHKYKEFADVFDKVEVDILPEHRPYECPIDLQPGKKKPSCGPIYNLSPTSWRFVGNTLMKIWQTDSFNIQSLQLGHLFSL